MDKDKIIQVLHFWNFSRMQVAFILFVTPAYTVYVTYTHICCLVPVLFGFMINTLMFSQ